MAANSVFVMPSKVILIITILVFLAVRPITLFAKTGLVHVQPDPQTFIFQSTAPGLVARDRPGENSLFTSTLVEVMKTPGLTIEDVDRQVRLRVTAETRGEQIPWAISTLVSSFSFTAPPDNPRYALIIGNAAYPDAPLRTPVNVTVQLLDLRGNES